MCLLSLFRPWMSSSVTILIHHWKEIKLDEPKKKVQTIWTESAEYLKCRKEIKYHNAEPEKRKKTDRWNFNAKKNNDDDDKICILLPLNGHYYVNKTAINKQPEKKKKLNSFQLGKKRDFLPFENRTKNEWKFFTILNETKKTIQYHHRHYMRNCHLTFFLFLFFSVTF